MTKIEINLKTFFIAFFFILGIYLAWQLSSILFALFISFILFSALKPLVDKLQDKGMNRILAVIIVYLIALILFVAVFIFLASALISEIRYIAGNLNINSREIILFINTNFPFLNNIINVEEAVGNLTTTISQQNLRSLSLNETISNIIVNLNPVASQGLSIIGRFIGGLVTIFIVIFLSIYMVIPRKDFYENSINLLPKKYSKDVNLLLDRIRQKLGAWVRGQLILMLFIGVATYLVIAIPSIFVGDYQLIQFGLVLAIIAGLLEAIPNIGPLITLLLAVLLTILTGGSVGLVIYIIIAFTLLQQIEAVLLVPTIMRKAIYLHPILVILAVLAGFEIAGPVGALFSIPIVGVIQIIAVEYLTRWKTSEDKRSS